MVAGCNDAWLQPAELNVHRGAMITDDDAPVYQQLAAVTWGRLDWFKQMLVYTL